MIDRRKTKWDEKGGHPPEDDLRLYVDGELEAPAKTLVRAHLEACWSCRVKLDEVQETIADFIGYRNQVLRPLVPPPPNNWRGFDTRLDQFSGGAGSRSWLAQLVSLLGKPFADLRALAGSPLMIRFAVGLLVTLVASVAWIALNREPVVTAAELIERATQAQTQQILSASQPVIHQGILIGRKRAPLAQTETVKMETWNDLNNARFKLFSGQSGGEAPDMLSALEKIFQTNRLDWRRPLSAVSFAEWRKSLSGKNDEILRTRLADGLEALSLRTVSTDPPRPGAVIESTLTVRARDWHIVSQALRVKEESGEAEYELVETAFEVVSLASVNPAVFAESLAAPLAAATPMAAPLPGPKPLPAIVPAPAPASMSLEIETLALLAQAGADLGEQVSVERTPEGALRIAGLVETEERKRQLKRALGPALGSPAVRFEIETVEEAMRRAKPAAAAAPTVVEQRAPTASALPVEEELRRYLSGQGRFTAEHLDGEVQRLARRTANASFGVRQRAQAMKRLVERFTPEQWQSFDETARARLLNLIESHATAVREQGQALRRSLQPIFNRGESPPASGGVEIASAPDLIRAINQLVELSATSDRAIQAAFTLSTDGAPAQAIKTPAFWSALTRLEQVAAQIQTGGANLQSAAPVRKQ
ncbi:MAG: zf-HC2 domain-containing protein [Blastocatellia bacterium]